MTWVAWRQYRMELILGTAMLGALSAFLVLSGLGMLSSFESTGLKECLSTSNGDCGNLREAFYRSQSAVTNITPWLNFTPAIIGVLLAAPILQEFEQRTYRLAWTQSITRERWLLNKLGTAILAAIIFAAIVTILMTWWRIPLDRAEGRFEDGFSFEGAMPGIYTIFALSLGLAAGALTRRSIPSMAAVMAGFLCIRLTVEYWLRPHYLPVKERLSAITDRGPTELPRDFWVLSTGFVDSAGKHLSDMELLGLCNNGAILRQNGSVFTTSGQGAPTMVSETFNNCLQAKQVMASIVYQPGDRFWTFQAIEAAIFLGMAAALLGLTVWLVRKRMS